MNLFNNTYMCIHFQRNLTHLVCILNIYIYLAKFHPDTLSVVHTPSCNLYLLEALFVIISYNYCSSHFEDVLAVRSASVGYYHGVCG